MNDTAPDKTPAPTTPAPEGDLLIGAKAIAAYLAPLTENNIYQLMRVGNRTIPIFKERGLGLVSSKSALDEWKRRRLAEAVAGRRDPA